MDVITQIKCPNKKAHPNQVPGTGTPTFNAIVIYVINYTCAVPVVTVRVLQPVLACDSPK